MSIWAKGLLALLVAGCVALAVLGYRAARVVQVATDFKDQVRYLIENGGTIGEAPAQETFSLEFLEAIFGDNPQLLDKLKSVVHEGLADEPALNVGEVAAMLVTYHTTPDGDVQDVVVHAIGGFPLARRQPGFHRHGYFFHQLDRDLWNMGNVIIGFLGRDMVLFAESEEVASKQQELIDSIFSGSITTLVNNISRPLHYTAVLPDPRRVVPPQLRNHIQAVVLKGSLAPLKGHWEALLLTPSVDSARYAISLLKDMKMASQLALKTRWHGVVEQTLWGPMIDTWWAYEMVQTMEQSTLERAQNLIRARSDFERVMVNAVLKTIERAGRDLAQMRGSLEEKEDPRVVDAQLQSKKPLHYWSEEHQWGPDWPIAPHTNVPSASPDATPTPGATPTAGLEPETTPADPAGSPEIAQAP